MALCHFTLRCFDGAFVKSRDDEDDDDDAAGPEIIREKPLGPLKDGLKRFLDLCLGRFGYTISDHLTSLALIRFPLSSNVIKVLERWSGKLVLFPRKLLALLKLMPRETRAHFVLESN